ncbi:MAG: tocopherol cyclase family protein, partial [bacterium]
MPLFRTYRGTGADLPWGDLLKAHPGVRLEGYFWRFTAPRDDGRVLIALCGVNRADDGTWSTLGLGSHPNGFLRAVEYPEGWADPDALGARAGNAFDGSVDGLTVALDPEAKLEVRVAAPVGWSRRSFGGSSVFQSVPALNQYWHPWLLGGKASGIAHLGGEVWELDEWQVYAEKNWGRGGFPDYWWWGQAQGFDEESACVAFAGGEIKSAGVSTEVTALVVRLPDGRLIRLGNPGVSPVAAQMSDESWSLRGRSPRWRVELEGRAPLGESHLLPVPLPRERRTIAGALEHLGGTIEVVVRERGRGVVWRGESSVAALEHGGLERAAAEAERRGFPGASAVPPITALGAQGGG